MICCEDRAWLQVLNRLLYRSKQRGLLELDLLIGQYSAANLPNLDMAGLKNAELVLTEENPDLWKWLTAQETAPERLLQNSFFLVRLSMRVSWQCSCSCST